MEANEPVLGAPEARTVHVGGPVHYRRWPGDGDRVIVCVHGLAECHFVWMPVAPGLLTFGDVISLDLPGFGLTPRCDRRLTVDAARSFLSGFLEEAVGRPAVLVGSSFGGAVAAYQASREPDTVEALVLSSSYLPPWYGGWMPVKLLRDRVRSMLGRGDESDEQKTKPDWLLDAARRAAGGEVPEDALRRQFHLHGSVDGRSSSLASAEAVGSLTAWSLRPGHVRRIYDGIRCPTLMLHGEDDSEVPVEWARKQHERRPDWGLRVLEGEGHVSRLDDPSDWLETVHRFLEQR